jgi:hypothetical protein
MGGLYHDFWLLPDIGEPYNFEYRRWNDAPAILLHDDVISLCYSTLLWIPTINPAVPLTDERHHSMGLNRWGPTVINHASANKAMAVFRGWADLLKEGPPQLQLTMPGECAAWDDSTGFEEAGTSNIFRADREKLVLILKTIAEYCQQATSGDFYVLHYGI